MQSPSTDAESYSRGCRSSGDGALCRMWHKACLPVLRSFHWLIAAGVEGPGVALMSAEYNDKPPYRHWHTVCGACGKVTLARPCRVPGEIEPVEPNPVVKCRHCEDTRQYLTSACFLAPLSAAASDRTGGTIAVVAGLIAAVKLARVESREIESRSPRVRSAISDSITIARMLIDASKQQK